MSELTHCQFVDDLGWQGFADTLGFNPHDVGPDGTLFSLTPRDMQTWIERADADRWVMRNGRWVR